MRGLAFISVMLAVFLCLSATRGHCWEEEYEFLLEWGTYGSDTSQFDRPRGMCCDKYGHVYVCDQNNQRVQKFDSLGNFILMFGSQGSGNGEFEAPEDVAVDDSGYIYVTDVLANRVQKFDSTGNFVLAWGDSGTGPGEFIFCRGLACDSLDLIHVCDERNHRIQTFDTQGNFVSELMSPDSAMWSPVSVTVHGSSVYSYSWHRPANIQKFHASGMMVLEWSLPGWAPEECGFAMDVASDVAGAIYITEAWNDRCQKFDGNGRLVAMWGSHGAGRGEFDTPIGIAIDRAGNLYVGDQGNRRIEKLRKKD